MYSDATAVLKEFNLSKRGIDFPGCDFFDVLWSTRNVRPYGFGLFDALFSVLLGLELLEEAGICFSKMKRFRVLPKVLSCNAFLHKICKSGGRHRSQRFLEEMVRVGIAPSVYTYNIVIDCMCKEGELETTRMLIRQMEEIDFTPDVVTYNSLSDGYGKLGSGYVKHEELLVEDTWVEALPGEF
ncbi:hypothetical protein V6N13_042294 [Hibiscus sabdariffa]|uniref:Pentatricopeptide repeat-containing protein n=1 Tax=Hibiscus sabdariffa TaxID=183260 RepID=A0ABR2DEK5_9ROSI